MKKGILWFDDSNAEFGEKVAQAMDYVHKKYRKEPRFCFVHPSMLENGMSSVKGLKICTNSSVMPNHFWLELVL